MKKFFLAVIAALLTTTAVFAAHTLPVEGSVILPTDPLIQYVGRISWHKPGIASFNFPGIEIRAAFEGTSLKMLARPKSGYFMVQINDSKAFKVAFTGEKDSLVTLAVGLPEGRHTVRVCYAQEGYKTRPEFWGFVLDEGKQLIEPDPLPNRRIEFIGNSITCAYGVESVKAGDPFMFATENHYYGFATLVSDSLNAVHMAVSRSGIGMYRNYGGPSAGSKGDMPDEYPYTLFNNHNHKWDFSSWTPDVVCINLGTNDFSTKGYNATLYKNAYRTFLQTVRRNYSTAKIILLTGCMLGQKENDLQITLLNELRDEFAEAGDTEIYRFDFSRQTGDLGYGGSWHPSRAQHQRMAAELTPFIRSLMNW